MICWILDNLIGILSIVVGAFIAYHVYFLSKKLELKDKLTHKDEVRKLVEPILQKIRQGRNSKCELVNVKKYLTHYPHTNDENGDGYTYFGGELKALRFDGIEFFCGVKEVYKTQGGNLSITKQEGYIKEGYNILEVGIVPYEWIEYIDARGDEFSYRPQFFCQFNGLFKTPYKYVVYYKESDVYHEGSDPVDMKWRQVEVEK